MIKKGMILALLLGVCSVEVNAAAGIFRSAANGLEKKLPSMRHVYSTASRSGTEVPTPSHSGQPRKWGRHLFAGGLLFLGAKGVSHTLETSAGEIGEDPVPVPPSFLGRFALNVAMRFTPPDELINPVKDFLFWG